MMVTNYESERVSSHYTGFSYGLCLLVVVSWVGRSSDGSSPPIASLSIHFSYHIFALTRPDPVHDLTCPDPDHNLT